MPLSEAEIEDIYQARDDVEVEPPTKEELGRYQSVGQCKCCQAHVYIEEYEASKVIRPKLIYTCSPDYCWAGFDERDVVWKPSFVGVL